MFRLALVINAAMGMNQHCEGRQHNVCKPHTQVEVKRAWKETEMAAHPRGNSPSLPQSVGFFATRILGSWQPLKNKDTLFPITQL